ncbi:MAG: LamG domain-containing protein, partial [Ignavibacteriales bacterium]
VTFTSPWSGVDVVLYLSVSDDSQTCIPNWQCTSWSVCINNQQTRTCTDSNNCGTNDGKPLEIQGCSVLEVCDNLVSLYHLDGNAQDSSGNNDGTINGATYTALGRFSGAYDFDGIDDSINAGSDASIDNLLTFTWSAWIYPTSWGENNYGRILGKNTNSGYEKALFFYNSAGQQTIEASFFDESIRESRANPNSISLNQWQNVVATFDNTADRRFHIYINGVEVSYSMFPALTGIAFDDSSYNLIIGNRANADRTFDGLIDEVAIWGRVLSQTEIQNLYNSGSPITCGETSICGDVDTSENNIVEIGELISYISNWKQGEVLIGELIDAIGKWKNGC